jgi:hypothetical protein
MLLVAGPNHPHATPLEARAGPRLRRQPTVLTLEDPAPAGVPASAGPGLPMTLPVVMFKLRESAQYDYMVPRDAAATAAARASAGSQQVAAGKVDIGPDRPREVASPNEEAAEYKARIRAKRVAQREARRSRYLDSDVSRWEQMQMARIHAKHGEEQSRRLNPFKPSKAVRPKTSAHYDPELGNVPDYMAEMEAEGHDRESLRDIAEWAKGYTPPPNYDARFKPAEPTVRKGRLHPV